MARGYVVVELYSHHIMYHPQSSGHGLSQEEEALKRPKDTGLVLLNEAQTLKVCTMYIHQLTSLNLFPRTIGPPCGSQAAIQEICYSKC